MPFPPILPVSYKEHISLTRKIENKEWTEVGLITKICTMDDIQSKKKKNPLDSLRKYVHWFKKNKKFRMSGYIQATFLLNPWRKKRKSQERWLHSKLLRLCDDCSRSRASARELSCPQGNIARFCTGPPRPLTHSKVARCAALNVSRGWRFTWLWETMLFEWISPTISPHSIHVRACPEWLDYLSWNKKYIWIGGPQNKQCIFRTAT